MKTKLIALVGLASMSSFVSAATVQVNNVGAGPGDYLYAIANAPLATGTSTLGTFVTGFDVEANKANFLVLHANFTSLTSGLIGSAEGSLGAGLSPGYAEYESVNLGVITTGNALLGKTLYSLVGDSATLGSSGAYALVSFGPIQNDVPSAYDYTTNPAAGTLVVGTLGTVTISDGSHPAGNGLYNTVNLVPEPSAALLGAVGALGLLRRRRN